MTVATSKVTDALRLCGDRLDAICLRLEQDVADFILMDRNNERSLGSVSFFTFEPHIAKPGSNLAFKHEEIYYFDNDTIKTI